MKKINLPLLIGTCFLFFNVQSQTTLYQEDFESGLGDMTIYDIDEETPINIDESLKSWNSHHDEFVGNVAAVSAFHNASSEDWMILPEVSITNDNTTLQWKARNITAEWFPMGFSVWVSTTGGNNISNFTNEIFNISGNELSSNWNSFFVSLDDFIGEDLSIAFKSSNSKKYLLEIDEIVIIENIDELRLTKFEPNINMNIAYQGNRNITIEVINLKQTTVSNFDVDIELNGSIIHSESFTGLNLEYSDKQSFILEEIPIDLGSNQSISCHVKNVNNQPTTESEKIDFECWDKVPNIEMVDVNGQTYNLVQESNSSPVVLDYFAAWCAPCRQEIDDLNQLSAETNVKVFSIAISNETNESLQNYLGAGGVAPMNPLFKFDIESYRLYNHYLNNIFNAGASVPYHVTICPENGEYALSENIGSYTYDTWVDSLSFCSSVSSTTNNGQIEVATKNSISISPNPTSNLIFIKLDDISVGYIHVYDSYGKPILMEKRQPGQEEIQLSFQNYPKGLYFITVISESGDSYSSKIIVEE